MPKFCSECGKELEENSVVCKNCGKKVESEIKVSVEPSALQPKKNNGFAIAGFVLSLVSLLCCGSTSFLGLIFSIIGLVNANKSEGEGKGLAIAGIIISAIILLVFILLYSLGIIASFSEYIANDQPVGTYY